MSFGTAIHKCKSITITGGYPAAERYFRDTKLPRSKFWSDNERPLYNVRCHHYRIEQRPNADYYDVKLYNTTMLRLFRPEADGTRELHLRAHGSSASNMFMWRVCGFGYAPHFDAQDGEKVHVPLSCYVTTSEASVGEVPENFSAKVVLDPVGRLIRERSAHYLSYSAVMSDEDKARREEMRQKLEPFIDMIVLRREYYHASYTTPRSHGRPFRSAHYRASLGVGAFKHWGDIGDNEFTMMDRLAHMVYNQVRASKEWRDSMKEVLLTPAEFRINYTRVILELMGLDVQSGKRMHGAFPTKIPRKYLFR